MTPMVSDMTWEELKHRADSIGVAIVPAGSTERHSKHLPMETDSASATEVARRVGDKTGAAVFPCLDYTIREHPAFYGVFLSDQTFMAMIREVCLSIEVMGFKKILFISGHGPNNAPVFNVLKALHHEKPKERLFGLAHCMTLINQLMPDLVKGRSTGHSDFRETSIMLAIDESKVHPEKAPEVGDIRINFDGQLESTGVHLMGLEEGSIQVCHDIDELRFQGGYGLIKGASKNEGEIILNGLADFLSRMVTELKKVELPLA
jgi:creatinine amidohydrolase